MDSPPLVAPGQETTGVWRGAKSFSDLQPLSSGHMQPLGSGVSRGRLHPSAVSFCPWPCPAPGLGPQPRVLP